MTPAGQIIEIIVGGDDGDFGFRARKSRKLPLPHRFVPPPTPASIIEARARLAQQKRARQAARQAKGMKP